MQKDFQSKIILSDLKKYYKKEQNGNKENNHNRVGF